MRLGFAQINPTVGDLAGNRRRIIDAYRELVAAGAELVIFPELSVCGYPPRDLLFKRRFVSDTEASLREIAPSIGDVPALIGTVERNPGPRGRPFYNAAAFCRAGTVAAMARKCLLPTYDVFDEDRYFEPAPEPAIVTHDGRRIGITICEDIWTHPSVTTRKLYHEVDPLKTLAAAKCDLMVNLSASPWHNEKGDTRRTLVCDAARALRCPVAYVNVVGGNDELIFDGRSFATDAGGTIIAGLPAFREQNRVIDIGASLGPDAIDPAFDAGDLADIHAALVLGLRDYGHKSGFRQALVSLSGGIDSAVVATLATAAFGRENVMGVSLPSAISSEHSRTDAHDLARNLGIRFETVPIAGAVDACEAALAPQFAGLPKDVTEENIQARVRGVMMMALSNKHRSLLLTTGNKSEIAVGYCTLYGDMAGGLAVISDVYKTQIYALARWINDTARAAGARPPIPQSSIDKPPSAELRPDQKDQDTLPPYEALDGILEGYVEQRLSSADLVAKGFDEAVVRDVVRKVDLNEYKRKQAAPGLKITSLAFGVGRRIPIVQKYIS